MVWDDLALGSHKPLLQTASPLRILAGIIIRAGFRNTKSLSCQLGLLNEFAAVPNLFYQNNVMETIALAF
jgi:hypothetical protein